MAEAIPGHWAADIRQSVINKYKNNMDTFLDSMKTKGAAGEYLETCEQHCCAIRWSDRRVTIV